jgi:hypothetical protein
MPLINISFPANAKLLSVILFNIANFDILPHETINGQIFDFDPEQTTDNIRFNTMGYDSTNFIRNAGTAFYFLVIWALVCLVTGVVYIVKGKRPRMNRLFTKLALFCFFSFVIRILLETYLDLLISVFLNIKALNFSESGEFFSSVMSVTMVSFLVIMPFGAFFMLHRTLSKFSLDKFQQKYGELFHGYRTSNYGYFYNANFLFRRLTYALGLVFIQVMPVS